MNVFMLPIRKIQINYRYNNNNLYIERDWQRKFPSVSFIELYNIYRVPMKYNEKQGTNIQQKCKMVL